MENLNRIVTAAYFCCPQEVRLSWSDSSFTSQIRGGVVVVGLDNYLGGM